MMRPYGTLRLIFAGYMALLMPLCCCYASVATECCAPADESTVRSQVRHEHDHGEGSHQHDGRGDDQQTPADHHRTSDPSCPGHDDGSDDGSCDCGCDDPGHGSFTVQTPASIDASLGFSHVVLPWLTPPFNEQVRPNEPATNPPRPPTSLVRLHCALLV